VKVIFLDFDGVLNSWAWWDRQPKHTRDQHRFLLDPAAVGLLNQLVMRTDAHVVISSSWRLNKEMRPASTLCVCGFTGVILGQTPYLAGPRGHEISAWLEEHSSVETFVILDDDSDMVHLAERHIKTSQQVGLTQEDVDRAVEMLGVERVCSYCLENGIRASLRPTTTARGEVQRCWQCGGEYQNGKRVWPEPSTTNNKDGPQ